MSRERERFEEIAKKIKRETNVFPPTRGGRRHMLGLPAGTLNTVTPCAACKLLRRRCAQECPFSPYFSPHEPQKFASVHRVFGASNVSKMLMEVAENQRADTANSLVYEANVRLMDPVYGCMGAISALQQQVQALQAELNAVKAEILKYKYSETNDNIINLPYSHIVATHSSNVVSVAVLPVAALPPTPQPPLPPTPPSIPITPTMYNTTVVTSSAADFSTITDGNITYFG